LFDRYSLAVAGGTFRGSDAGKRERRYGGQWENQFPKAQHDITPMM
jgi:hypothetical protein